MRTTLKTTHHEHTLILRNFSQGIDYRCEFCKPSYNSDQEPLSGEIDNQAYCCEDCNFFVHKWPCAELPQQIQHPAHPQHPLSRYFDGYYFEYRCGESECKKYKLDAVSALATLPSEDTKPELDFFGHHHPLNFFHVKIPTEIKCKVCKHKIRGCSVYGCRACLFLIHESCAQLPRKIENHPLHPGYLLNLELNEVYIQDLCCKLCGISVKCGASYISYDAESALHVNCAVASAIPPSDIVKLDHHPSHARHKLISGYLNGGHNRVECQICLGLIKSGEVYGCTKKDNKQDSHSLWFRTRESNKSLFVHKTCAQLPFQLPWEPRKELRRLRHPFCPNTNLKLIQKSIYDDSEWSWRRCYACGNKIYMPYYKKGDFFMHAVCAIETLSAILKGGVTPKIQHFADDDLFFTCYIPELQDGKEEKCLACRKSIKGLGYYCREISERIHKACAEQLYKQLLQHPLHPQHPLLLQSSDKRRGIFFCKGCNNNCETTPDYSEYVFRYYYYSCGACEFHLDLKCALRKPTLKDPCHQHDLAYFEHVKYMFCNACGYSCNNDLYRCVECNFNVHLDCLPLPSVVEDNECHLHPLTICDKVPDQDCGVCRLEMNPRHGAYYCEECNFVAHIECAVYKGVKPKHSPSLEKEISKVERALEEIQKKMQKHESILNTFKSMRISQGEAFEE